MRESLALCLLGFILCQCHGQQSASDSAAAKNPTNTALRHALSRLDHGVHLVFQDQKHHWWFGKKDQGVFRFDGVSLAQFTKADGLISDEILSIQEDGDGHLFFESFEGVAKYDGQSFRALPILDTKEETSWQLSRDDLWFRLGWNQKGPYRYDGQALQALKFPPSPGQEAHQAANPNASYSPYGIYSMYRDRKGFMWFGTTSLGVCRFDGSQVQWLYEPTMFNTASGGEFGVRSMLEDDQGYFWFNRINSRYHIRHENAAKQTTHLPYQTLNGLKDTASLYFLAMVKDAKGHFWMVTFDEGVWHRDGETLTSYPVKHEGKPVLLSSIYQDPQGGLWLISRNKGLFVLRDQGFEKFRGTWLLGTP